MARLKVVETAEGKTQEMLDTLNEKLGRVPNIFKGMANSEATLGFYMAGSGALGASKLTGLEREAIALAIANKNECKYCTAAHSAIAKMQGASEEEVAKNVALASMDEKTQSLINFSVQVLDKKGFVSDEELEAFKSAGYTDEHVADVAAVVAFNVFTNLFNHINDTEVDF